MSVSDDPKDHPLARIIESYNRFVNVDVSTVDLFENIQRSEQIARELLPLKRRAKGLRMSAKRMVADACGADEEIKHLEAEKAELDYIIRETKKSPFSHSKAFFMDERRSPGGRQTN